jgi:hypothetical protein
LFLKKTNAVFKTKALLEMGVRDLRLLLALLKPMFVACSVNEHNFYLIAYLEIYMNCISEAVCCVDVEF